MKLSVIMYILFVDNCRRRAAHRFLFAIYDDSPYPELQLRLWSGKRFPKAYRIRFGDHLDAIGEFAGYRSLSFSAGNWALRKIIIAQSLAPDLMVVPRRARTVLS